MLQVSQPNKTSDSWKATNTNSLSWKPTATPPSPTNHNHYHRQHHFYHYCIIIAATRTTFTATTTFARLISPTMPAPPITVSNTTRTIEAKSSPLSFLHCSFHHHHHHYKYHSLYVFPNATKQLKFHNFPFFVILSSSNVLNLPFSLLSHYNPL